MAYDCDMGSAVVVTERPRDTLVLWLEDEPARALTALPSVGLGRLWATDALDWRAYEDGTAELTLYPQAAANEPHALPQTERCGRSAP